MAAKLYTISKIKEFTDGVGGVIVEGALDSYEQATSKNGGAYLKGVLRDKSDTLAFKIWDETLDSFRKKNGLKEDEVYVVQMSGDIQVYNGELQLIARPFNNGLTVAKMDDRTLDDYLKTSFYPTRSMLATVRTLVEKQVLHPQLKAICVKTLEKYSEEILYYPLSTETHAEKGGFLSHLYNCISKCVNIAGDPKVFTGEGNNVKSIVDKQVIITSLLTYHLFPLVRYTVDKKTGIILDEGKYLKTLFGAKAGNIFHAQLIILETCSQEGFSPEVMNVLHTIIALNTEEQYATLEAQMTAEIIRSELAETQMQAALEALSPNEVAKTSIMGESRNVVRLKKSEPAVTQEVKEAVVNTTTSETSQQ